MAWPPWAFRAGADFRLLDWKAPLVSAAAGAVLVSGVLVARDATLRRRPWHLLVLLPAFGLGTWGAAVFLNRYLDRSPPREFRTFVLAKESAPGRSRSGRLELEPRGPRDRADQIHVAPAVNDALAPGDAVKVVLRDGRFGWSWFYVLPDPAGGHKDAPVAPRSTAGEDPMNSDACFPFHS